MLDPRRLRILTQIARCGTIAAAADALNFSASALSQQLRTLESELGCELVVRSSRAATLTEAGALLADHGVLLEAELGRALESVHRIADLEGGRLRMATFRTAGETIVADAFAYFRAHWPAVRLTLLEGEPEDYLDGLRADRLDLALTHAYAGIDSVLDDRLVAVELLRDELLVALPEGHPCARAGAVELAALRDERWVVSTTRSAVHDFTRQTCANAGFEARIGFASDDYHVAQALVAHGGGAVFVPALVARSMHPGLVTVSVLDHDLHRTIYAAHRRGGERSPAVATMLDILRDLGDAAG